MWRVGNLASVWGIAAVTAPSAPPRRSSTPPSAPVEAAPSDAYIGDGLSRRDLIAMNAGVDSTSRLTNTLMTARDAIGVIGGLLGHVHSALAVAKTSPASNVAEEQTRIDSAVTTLDAIASSTRFGGQALLDGTFTTSVVADGSQKIRSFLSSKLGQGADGTGAPLASLTTGGANDLASGNHEAADQIVATALAQVAQTQTSINGFLSQQTIDYTSTDAPIPPTRDSVLLSDPARATAAVANTPAHRVLALLSA